MSDRATPLAPGADPGADPGAAPDPEPRDGRGRRVRLPLLLLLVAIAGASFALASTGGHHAPALPGDAQQTRSPNYVGATLTPTRAAPPLVLDDSLGRRVDLAQDRGRVVLVTFLYTHCPDVCPLIASNLRNTLTRLGPLAKRVQLIAVSVDPRNDRPSAVRAFLRVHALTGRMEYLLGSAHQLGRVWKAWNVGSEQDAGNPEFVAHSALVYGIAGSGKLTTIYAANFKPADIAHDVPLLLRN